MVDLSSSSNPANKVATLRSNLLHSAHSRSTNNLANIEKSPVHTGVSVRALVSVPDRTVITISMSVYAVYVLVLAPM